MNIKKHQGSIIGAFKKACPADVWAVISRSFGPGFSDFDVIDLALFSLQCQGDDLPGSLTPGDRLAIQLWTSLTQ